MWDARMRVDHAAHQNGARGWYGDYTTRLEIVDLLLQNFKPLLGALLGTTGATAGPVWERGVEKFP